MANNSFSSIIQDFFRRNGGWPRLKGELAVYFWPKIAGSEIAKQVEAKHFRAGVLYLQTDSPALAHQIQMMNLDIIKKYQKLLGVATVKGIRVKIGALGIPTTYNKPKIQPLLTNNEKKLIEDCSQVIIDPDLAEKFKGFMCRSLLNHHIKEAEGGKRCQSCGVIIDDEFIYCPSCETKVKEEMKAYFEYQKKHNNLTLTNDDLSKNEGISYFKIRKF